VESSEPDVVLPEPEFELSESSEPDPDEPEPEVRESSEPDPLVPDPLVPDVLLSGMSVAVTPSSEPPPDPE
jgi:hypothetical protein